MPTAIDWAAISDDEGDLREVGTALAQLASPDAKARKKAFAKIDDRVVHQGGFVSPAAAPLVRVLLGHVRDAKAPHRAEALRLAVDAAVGGHFNHVGAPIGRSRLWPAVAKSDARLVLVAAYDDLVGWLRDADAEVRANAALALAFVPERAADVVAAIDGVLAKERSASVRATAILVLGLVGASSPGSVSAALLRALDTKETERSIAAIAWLHSQPHALDDVEKTAIVLEATEAPRDKKLGVANGEIGRLAVGAIESALATDGRATVARDLAARVAGSPAEEPVLRAWLDGHVPVLRPLVRFPKLRSELDADALAVLRDVASIVHERPDVAYGLSLGQRGLFDWPADLERFLGLTPPGPLDETIDDRPLWAWLTAARDDEAAATAFLAALTGRDVLPIVKDAATTPYRLSTAWPPTKTDDRAAPFARIAGRLLALVRAKELGAWVAEVASGPRHPARPTSLDEWTAPQIVLEGVLARTDVVPEPAHLEPLIGTAEAARNEDLRARALARFPR